MLKKNSLTLLKFRKVPPQNILTSVVLVLKSLKSTFLTFFLHSATAAGLLLAAAPLSSNFPKFRFTAIPRLT